MTAAGTLRIARWLALVAGGLDLGTGLALVAAPAFTLRLMLVPVPGAEALVYVRFVGAFVAAVGFSYLWALAGSRGGNRIEALREVLRGTIPFRVAAGTYSLVGVTVGWLAPAWLVVTVADYGLVFVQRALLQREWSAG